MHQYLGTVSTPTVLSGTAGSVVGVAGAVTVHLHAAVLGVGSLYAAVQPFLQIEVLVLTMTVAFFLTGRFLAE